MRQIPHLIAACAFALVFSMPGPGQDSPSLGDLARQAQKDKANNAAPKKVFTNDDLPSGSGLSAFGIGATAAPGTGRVVQPGSAAPTSAAASASDQLGRMESMLNELDAMDRATLATKVLEGDETKFPARGNWEAQLFAAKNVFVAKGRDIMKKATQLQASAKDIQDVQNPNDPRAKELAARLQQLIQEATQAGQAFQAIIAQGKELASQTSAH